MMIGSTDVAADGMARAVDLLARLVGALELREESDPDSPPWAAEREIRRLEHEIVACLHNEAWLSICYSPDAAPGATDRQPRTLAKTRALGPLD
jgi:hypothetical protein